MSRTRHSRAPLFLKRYREAVLRIRELEAQLARARELTRAVQEENERLCAELELLAGDLACSRLMGAIREVYVLHLGASLGQQAHERADATHFAFRSWHDQHMKQERRLARDRDRWKTKAEGLQHTLDVALNSGDGSYKP